MGSVAHLDVLPAPRSGGSIGAKAKLSLVDALLVEHEARPCATLALRWLARHTGIERAVCVAADPESGRLAGLTGLGVPPAAVEAFSLDLADRTHPLVVSLSGGEPVAFHDSGQTVPRPFETPLGHSSFHVVPLGSSPQEMGPGLLLLTGAGDGPVTEDVLWAAELLGTRLAALGYRRIQADERRHKRERSLLLAVIHAVTDPILLTDADGRILIANTGAETLLTAGEEKREGWRRAVALNNMLFSASLFTAENGPTRRELLLVDPSEGQELLFEVLSTPVAIRAGENGIVSVLRNVTDLRRATEEIEENYRRLRLAEAATRAERDRLDLILNSVLEPILVTDPAGNIVRMNPPAERMFTFPARRDGRDNEVERRVQANDAVFTSFVSNLYAGQSLRWRGELNLLDPRTGATIPVEAISGRVVSKHGEETAVVTILHDLTEAMEKALLYEQVKRHSEELREKVREATAELAEQNELLRRQAFQLEQASAMKSQFLANVSHELRTPLNAIMGYTHLMLEGVSGDLNHAQQDKLTRVDANARHLLAVINDLLDITRIESGKMPVQVERIRLPELIDEVMTEVEPVIAGTRLAVTRSLPAELPEIETDRQKVKQIVLNLLSNALKFTPEGSVAIRLDHHGPAGEISIAVSDTGIGIAEENQKTIFEAFEQANSSLARRQGGTGLGLTICRRLASLLDGRIALASRLGEGSTFTLFLPANSRPA
ncbi:MAG TPA: ATP-binding protein [Thermoanaerobaculia bacterium]|jgi:PAS domain S-box-containing protein|nr:ATP-binding protein [Thermoanaerobaculia bacterium]